MMYFGGKHRVAKDIVSVINTFRTDCSVWFFEPFIGGANVITKLHGNRVASDANKDLIRLYRAMQEGLVLPKHVSEEEYRRAKEGQCDPRLRAFIGFGCSFAGKWFGGYAKSGMRNYAVNAARSLEKKRPGLIGIRLFDRPYQDFTPRGMVIYCDPPYQGTTQYGAVGGFDSSTFWITMSKWCRNNVVLVSEYNCPINSDTVWEKEVITDIRGKDGRISRVEKLFFVKQ